MLILLSFIYDVANKGASPVSDRGMTDLKCTLNGNEMEADAR